MRAVSCKTKACDESGFTIIELLIVLAMMTVLTGFLVVEIVQARQGMTRTTAALEMLSYLEKARLDSVRRHPDTTAVMAQVAIINAKYYSVRIDADRDGRLDEPRVVNLPASANLSFRGPFPRTILFDWRGMTVDSGQNLTTPDAISIGNSYGVSTVRIASSGKATLERNN